MWGSGGEPQVVTAFHVGQIVTRYLSSAKIPVELRVKEIKDGLIYCEPPTATWPLAECWKFREDTLGEVDEGLGWDGIRVTGSILKAPAA